MGVLLLPVPFVTLIALAGSASHWQVPGSLCCRKKEVTTHIFTPIRKVLPSPGRHLSHFSEDESYPEHLMKMFQQWQTIDSRSMERRKERLWIRWLPEKADCCQISPTVQF